MNGFHKWILVAFLVVGIAALGIGFGFDKPQADEPSQKTEAPKPAEQKNTDEVKTISGRVVGPDGKPVKGAVIWDVEYQRDGRGVSFRTWILPS